MVTFKKGAMFGLDARIALAIFGALSVISGAALYSAIQESKVTAMITELQEIGKAVESYYVDTGSLPPIVSSDPASGDYLRYQAVNLIEKSGVVGWNGPYLPYEKNIMHSEEYVLHPTKGHVYILRLTPDVDWADFTFGECTAGTKCFIWIGLNKMSGTDLAKAIDAKVDNSDGSGKGDFRWASSGGGYYNYILKMMPIKNYND
jgi:type II secretory pathway pseudopilin PulG